MPKNAKLEERRIQVVVVQRAVKLLSYEPNLEDTELFSPNESGKSTKLSRPIIDHR